MDMASSACVHCSEPGRITHWQVHGSPCTESCRRHPREPHDTGLVLKLTCAAVCKGTDDVAEGRQRQVDSSSLPQAFANGPCAALALAARQVYQVELAHTNCTHHLAASGNQSCSTQQQRPSKSTAHMPSMLLYAVHTCLRVACAQLMSLSSC
jgi:hypothetical protein